MWYTGYWVIGPIITYTKIVSESSVGEATENFPTVVVRPSIGKKNYGEKNSVIFLVSTLLREPVPGLFDNLNRIKGFIWNGNRGEEKKGDNKNKES